MALYKCPFCKKEIEDGIDALVDHRKEECWEIQAKREKEAMDIQDARRKSFDVKYVVVTEENLEEVAEWCGGEVGGEGKERFVKVTDKNAISTRQAKAFVDDYVLRMSDTGTSFKAFTAKAFNKTFEPIVASGERVQEVARSAKSGQFVSHEEAEANPDTTVVEKMRVTRHDSEIGPDGKIFLKGKAWAGETEIKLPNEAQPYWEVVPAENAKSEDDVETIYYNASGEVITKAEFDAWESNA